MYGVTWFPLKSSSTSVQNQNGWKKNDTNQTKRIDSKKRSLCVLMLIWDQFSLTAVSLNASLFHHFVSDWKGTSGFLLLTKKEEKPHSPFSFWVHNPHLYKDEFCPSSTHTVVTLITTSRLAAALIRGSLDRSWLRMCKMVYPQWWLRIVLNLRLWRAPLLLARLWGVPREPRAPALLLELTGSPKSFDFS